MTDEKIKKIKRTTDVFWYIVIGLIIVSSIYLMGLSYKAIFNELTCDFGECSYETNIGYTNDFRFTIQTDWDDLISSLIFGTFFLTIIGCGSYHLIRLIKTRFI